jgi:hypothetical protein
MKKRVKGLGLFFSIFIFLILIIGVGGVNVSAGAVVGNGSQIKDSYSIGAGQKINGWLNISITNEVKTSYFSDNFGNIVGISSFLNALNKSDYWCTPANCEGAYILQGTEGSESKSITLSGSGEKIIGLNVNGKNANVNSLKINVGSDAAALCESQLIVDINNDNFVEWGNKNYINENCGGELKSSCYPASGSSGFSAWLQISEEPYCEQINLSASPAFEIKTVIQRTGTQITPFYNGLLKAWIYGPDGKYGTSCDLSQPSSGSSGSVVSCLINYVVKQKGAHYVCISGKEGSGIVGYAIQGKETPNFCGFQGDPTQTGSFTKEYNIVAQAKKFNSVGTAVINEASVFEQTGASLADSVNNYLSLMYNKDCSGGCVIPIRLSGISQQITVGSIDLQYTSEGSAGTMVKSVYEVSTSDAKISSKYAKLDLNALNFSIPMQGGNKTWALYFNNEKIFEKNISIDVKPISLIWGISSLTAYGGENTGILVLVDDSALGKNFKWNFGDNSPIETTTEPNTKHMYSYLGNYTLQVEISDGVGKIISSSKFDIKVVSPIDRIKGRIDREKAGLAKVTAQIDALQTGREKIKDVLKIEELSKDISDIESTYTRASSSSSTKAEDYVGIMKNLENLEIPRSITESQTASLIFIDDYENIDPEVLEELFDEDISDASKNIVGYKWGIYRWAYENLAMNLNYNLISAYYDTKPKEDLISNFELTITPTKSIGYPVYVVIKKDEGDLIFKNEYDSNNIGSATGTTGVKLSLDSSKTVSFSILGRVLSNELPIFISPSLENIEVGGELTPPGELKNNFFTSFLMGLIILLIIAFIAYIFLQEWYKKNYEKSLFKNQNELYNLISFISNAKKQGLKEEDIKKKLREQKWKNEQIEYAIKKFKGERVGMWEIPVFKLIEKKKTKQELAKRSGKKVAY